MTGGDPLRPLWGLRRPGRERATASAPRSAEAAVGRGPRRGPDPARARRRAARAHRRRRAGSLDEAEALAANERRASALERGRLRRSSGEPAAALPALRDGVRGGRRGGRGVPRRGRGPHGGARRRRPWRASSPGRSAASTSPERLERPGGRLLGGPAAQQPRLGRRTRRASTSRRSTRSREALRVREREPEQRAEIEIARYALGKTLRALGRPDEAAALLEQAVAWAAAAGAPDGWFHEELAEDVRPRSGADDAGAQRRRGSPCRCSRRRIRHFADDAERATRLHRLAGA